MLSGNKEQKYIPCFKSHKIRDYKSTMPSRLSNVELDYLLPRMWALLSSQHKGGDAALHRWEGERMAFFQECKVRKSK